jgi:hypothetical protein
MYRMSRITCPLAFLGALLLTMPLDSVAQCERDGIGDICASGSLWYEFTRVRIEPLEKSGIATTMTLHPHHEFSLDIGAGGGRGTQGKIIVIAGRAMLMRGVPHEKGYEIDALDGPVLMNQLAMTLLDQAFPKGPASVITTHKVRIAQKTRAIRIATASASARFEPPWTLTGAVQRADGRIRYDLRFTSGSSSGVKSFQVAGYWVKESSLPPVAEQMSLVGWTLHWLGQMTTTSEQGTMLDYAAKPASGHWKDVAALRKWIDAEPARRASRRLPVDAANPGRLETLTYEASEVDKRGARRRLGEIVREYRPGMDVAAEDTQHQATRKTLAIGHGLSLSTDVYREPTLKGFGLVLVKDDSPCFSWEWFDRESGDVFRKRLGGGKVKVSVVESAGYMELAGVEFLDDITLQCEDGSNGTTHEARIKKGSVFRLRP